MKKRIFKGSSDFKEFIETNSYYIDKTLFAKDVIFGDKVQLYARPRRFGKTLNLSMLYYFFTNEKDYSYLFDGLKITQDNEAMAKQGKYPVIFLSFKNTKLQAYDETINKIASIISELYENHYDNIKDILTDIDEKLYFSIIKKSSSITELSDSLYKLSRYLYKKYNQRVIILLDEYDVPIQQGYLNNFYKDIVNFMHNLFIAALKDNPNVERAVLTGVTRVSKESIFSGLNNIEVNTVLQSYAADKFGITEQELNELVEYYDAKDHLPTINEWYNGYNIAGHKIFNPWSVMNYLDKRIPDVYWANTSDNALIKDLLQRSDETIKAGLYDLVEGNKINIKINEHTDFNNLATNNNIDTIYSFLMLSGYLTYDNIVYGIDKNCDVYIPNQEIKSIFLKNVIPNWFENEITKQSYTALLTNIENGNIDLFIEKFESFVFNSFSYFDVTEEEPERFYHAFMLGLLVGLKDKYQIISNRETGIGRTDLALLPKDNKYPGYVIEFKRKLKRETVEQAIEKAKNQIIQNNYEQILKDNNISQIYRMAIVFEGKIVHVDVF